MKTRKQVKSEIVNYLENNCHFRDYRILPERLFGKVNRIGIHHMFCADVYRKASVEYEIDDAINTFCRDGYPMIYFYV